MSTVPPNPVIDELRQRIQRFAGQPAHDRKVLPFGIETIDRVLPGGGLSLGALHEVAGGGNGAIDGAAAALFTAGIAARTKGKAHWVASSYSQQFVPARRVASRDVVAPQLPRPASSGGCVT
jgi:protein ImuA